MKTIYLFLLLAIAGVVSAGASESDPMGACCYEKPRPDGTVIYECESPRTENFCDNHQNGVWSEGLSCDEVSCPPIEVGSCCLDCEPESGLSDQCADEVIEEACDGLGGSWLLDTPCGKRDDCSDSCPVPVVGGICTPIGWPPSDNPHPDETTCVDEITIDQCVDLFDVDYCETFWQEGALCEDLHCREVPTMPRVAYAVLAGILAGFGWFVARRRSYKRGLRNSW